MTIRSVLPVLVLVWVVLFPAAAFAQDYTITKTHTGVFAQGQTGAQLS